MPRLPLSFSSTLLAVVAFAHAAAADSFRHWQVDCAAVPRACILSTSALAGDDTWLGTLRLQLAAGEVEAARLQALVPPSVHLGSGLFLGVGRQAPLPLAYLRCAPDHC